MTPELRQWMADVDEELYICEWKKSKERVAAGSARPAVAASPRKPQTAALSPSTPSVRRTTRRGLSYVLRWPAAFIAAGVITAWICARLATSPGGL